MAYATVQDLISRFGQRELVQLTDLDNLPPTTVNEARVQLALDDASALVDAYIGQAYKLPLTGCAKPVTVPGEDPEYVTPPLLVQLTSDLARFNLYDDLAPENEVARRQAAAIKQLGAIGEGKAVLSCPWGGEPGQALGATAQSGGEDVAYSFSCRSVTDDTLRGY